MTVTKDWIVHPNRLEPAAAAGSRNGQFRPVSRPAAPVPASTCLARVELPDHLAHFGAKDGTVTFGGDTWWFVVAAARAFARHILNEDVPPPFGFKDRGTWWWWDNTTTTDSILETPEATQYVLEYLEQIFANCTITITDQRP